MGREQYCPNMFYDTNQVSIGEFNTLQECMDFPIRDIWCINREEDNLFEKYKSQGNRVLIICCWERSDKWRFVVAIVKDGNAKYFDFNDLPMDLVQSDFETYIGKDAVATIKGLNECTIYNKETNENKIMNKKQVIRLNENQLRQIVAESVKKILKEANQDYSDYTEEDKIRDYVYSLDADEAFDYIIKNSQTGLEIELDCGIYFGMGLYAWKDEAEKFLPKDMLSPMRNDLFVSLEKPNVLKTYIKNAFRKNGTLAAY